jgi:succinoglycan biosynthesis transport protein ExoP
MIAAPIETPPDDQESSALPVHLGEATHESALSDAWTTIRKRLWIILALAAIGAGFGWYKATTQPRLYDSTGTIEIRSGSTDQYRLNANGQGAEGTGRIPTQVALLTSDTLLLSVAKDLNLENNPLFGGNGEKGPQRSLDNLAVRSDVLGQMQNTVHVTPVAKTDLIHISASTLDSKLSADIVNRLITDYIHISFLSRSEASKRVTDFFSGQLDDLQKEVEDSQGKMIDLQRQLGVLGFDPTLNAVTNNLADLNKATNAAELARIQAETRYRVLAGTDADSSGQQTDAGRTSPAVAAIRGQLDTARATLAQLSANLGPNHPQVLAAREQIGELTKQLHEEQNRVLAEAKANFVAARAEERETQNALTAQQAESFKMRDQLIDYTLKQREFNANRTLYENLREKLRTAGVQAGLESTEIDIVDVAVPAIFPSLRPRSTIVLINTIAMLIAGIVLAFVLESLDTGLGTIAEIEAVSGLPTLALVPRTRRGVQDSEKLTNLQRNLAVIASPKSQVSEAYRALRTSLLLSIAGSEPQTILLTSATPAEGKTTVSMNLAAVLTQRGVRVLLIDADLRRPTVHHRLGLEGVVGLTSVLTGSATLREAVQSVPDLPGLDVLVSGPVPPFPTEMISSPTMKTLLEECRGLYTHIVMDSPPLLSVTDSVVLARDADAVVLIVRQGKSNKHALRRARDLLLRSGAGISGVVLNAVDTSAPDYASHYGYYGYSGYGSEGVDGKSWTSRKGRDE